MLYIFCPGGSVQFSTRRTARSNFTIFLQFYILHCTCNSIPNKMHFPFHIRTAQGNLCGALVQLCIVFTKSTSKPTSSAPRLSSFYPPAHRIIIAKCNMHSISPFGVCICVNCVSPRDILIQNCLLNK